MQKLEDIAIPHNMPSRGLIEVYHQLYDLPVLNAELEIPLPLLFQYANLDNFVIIFAYDQHYQVFVERREGDPYNWQLPGGKVQERETFDQAIARIAHDFGLRLETAQPLAKVQNFFRAKTKEISHEGLAFMARVQKQPISEKASELVGLPLDEVRNINLAFANNQVAKIALDKINASSRYFSFSDEIEANKQYPIRFAFHHNVISPLLHRFSSAKIRGRVQGYIENPKTFIDLAVGDDTLIFETSKQAKICIANDISRGAYQLLQKHNPPQNIIFTNHDVLDLPFKTRFDVGLFKNTLHHLKTKEQYQALAENLKKVCRQIILVDIEDPTTTGFLSNFWHQYYVKFLGDRGDRFLTSEQFKDYVRVNFSECSVKFDDVRTIKGNYMFAVIDYPNT